MHNPFLDSHGGGPPGTFTLPSRRCANPVPNLTHPIPPQAYEQSDRRRWDEIGELRHQLENVQAALEVQVERSTAAAQTQRALLEKSRRRETELHR